MPLLKIDFMSRVLALAEPVPLTVAILMVKSLTRLVAVWVIGLSGFLGTPMRRDRRCAHRSGDLGLLRLDGDGLTLRVRPVERGLLHVPRRGRAALGAQAAVHAQVLVLHHHAPGLRQAGRHVQELGEVLRRGLETRAQVGLGTVVSNGEAVDRADVDAGVALDAQLRAEHGLHVAVEAALHLLLHLLGGEAELHLDVELLEALLERDVRHQAALNRRVVVGVAPLVHAHLAARQTHSGRQPLLDRLALAEAVDGDGRLVAVLDGPDDVLRPEGGIPAEKHLRTRRLEGDLVDERHVPLVELDAEVALYPGEGVLLADGEDDVVRRQELLAGDALGRNAALRVELVLHLVEEHAGELAVLDDEGLGRAVDDDLDALLLRILELPDRGLEEAARLARHHLHVLGAQAQARAAAVHRRVADPDDEHAPADLLGVAEGDRYEPGDADVDVGGALLATGEAQLLALRGTGADEHRIVAAALQQSAHALDRGVQAQIHAHAGDHGNLLVQHRCRQPERGDVAAHETAGFGVLLEDRDLVAEGHEIVRNREGGAAGADEGHLLAVLQLRHLRQPCRDIVAVVGGDALQAADRDWLLFDAPATAGRLAGTVADASEDAGEDVGLAVHHVGIGEAALGDQSDVLRDIGVSRTGPLAIYNSMVVVGVRGIGRFHSLPGREVRPEPSERKRDGEYRGVRVNFIVGPGQF